MPTNTTAAPSILDVTVSFIDTSVSVLDIFFLPWMRAVTDRVRPMSGNLFPRCNITIECHSGNVEMSDETNKGDKEDAVTPMSTDLSQPNVMAYELVDAYPVLVDSANFSYSNKGSIPVRQVRFKCRDVRVITYNDKDDMYPRRGSHTENGGVYV
jgi:hypothetical protein